jgi:NAD(P)-dependent dehydrogenase (short-subunit alcohol dehydrogenase family)
MSNATTTSPIQREPELLGQTVVVIGGSSGIGLETARRARAEGAKLILAGRNPERLQRAAGEVNALSTAAFDATDPASLERFFRDLPATIDHVMVTAGRPYYRRLVDMDLAEARQALDTHLMLVLQVARNAANKMQPGGTLLFMSGTEAAAPGSASRSYRQSPLRSTPSRPTWRSSSRPSESTSSPPGSSTHHCRQRSWAMNSKTAANSFAPRCPSGASSDRPTSPHSPYTS